LANDALIFDQDFSVLDGNDRDRRAVFRRNQKLLYSLLMQVSATAVKDLCAHKRHLWALPGMLAVLHTRNGQLGYHPHAARIVSDFS
jgi:hypothetical protein